MFVFFIIVENELHCSENDVAVISSSRPQLETL